MTFYFFLFLTRSSARVRGLIRSYPRFSHFSCSVSKLWTLNFATHLAWIYWTDIGWNDVKPLETIVRRQIKVTETGWKSSEYPHSSMSDNIFPQGGQLGAFDMFITRAYQCTYEKIALGIFNSRSNCNSTGLLHNNIRTVIILCFANE